MFYDLGFLRCDVDSSIVSDVWMITVRLSSIFFFSLGARGGG